MTQKNAKGFTLIELLVVIAIIGILAAIIITGLVAARNSAQTARAKIEMRELAEAFSYAKANSGKSLSQMDGQTWSAGVCTSPSGSGNLPTPNLENNKNSTATACYNQWVKDLAAIQKNTGGLYGNLASFGRDPWGSPYILDENEGNTDNDTPTDICVNDSITSAGPNGSWDSWFGDPTADDITIFVPDGTAACAGKDQVSGFAGS